MRLVAAAVVLLLVGGACGARGQERLGEGSGSAPGETAVGSQPAAAPTNAATAGEPGQDFATVIGYGGMIGYSILGLSVLGCALAGRFFYELRRAPLLPAQLARRLQQDLAAGQLGSALDRSQGDGSLLGGVVAAGLRALPDGHPEATRAMAEAADRWMGTYLRRIEYVNVIAAIAPMLGLLGTVVGMVKTFAALSRASGPVDPSALSAGIFQALVTTMIGLAVAIPMLLLFTILRNRADELSAVAAEQGERLLAPAFGPGGNARAATNRAARP